MYDQEQFQDLHFWFRRCGYVVPREGNGEYYVYIATDEANTIIYIGSGKGERYKHVTSGISHNKMLNKLYFSGETLSVNAYRVDLTKNEAMELERQLTEFTNPAANLKNKTVQGASRYNKSPMMLFIEFGETVYNRYKNKDAPQLPVNMDWTLKH